MKPITTLFAGAILAVAAQTALAAEDPADVKAVVDAVKASNSDLKALCQAPDGVRKAVSEKTRELAMAGKLKGNPQAIGAEAGQALGKECRG